MTSDQPGVERRDFLGLMAKGTVGLMLWPHLPKLLADDGPSGTTQDGDAAGRGRAKAMIVLYMAGGPSHIDTFDPKPRQATAGRFKPIDTAIKGVQFSEHLPRLAKEAQELTIIRSMSTKEGNHRRASYLMRTGHFPQGPVAHPGLGAIVSKYKSKENFPLPSFVSINSPSEGGGFLGVEHSPFIVQDPTEQVANLTAPESVDAARFKRRWGLLGKVEDRFAVGRREDMVVGHRKVYEAAERFMHSKLSKAFDVSQEKEALRESYGMNKFGQGCLMARRLVEVGVPFIEVTLGGWDTHRNNFETVKGLSEQLDPAFAALLKDLRDRKLLDQTLIAWVGDFGRTPNVNPNDGRDHYPRAWSSVLAGAGVARGHVLGDSGPQGMEAAGRPVPAADLYATFAHCLGLDRGLENIAKSGRPIPLVDKKGVVIKEIL